MSVQELITENIDLWTSAIKVKNTQGRGSSKKWELYGIKKLRGLILELAVRGKLVPQDPNDEPASVLLQRIAEEKAQLIKDKKIKKQKLLPKITDEEKPFELPYGWGWARLGEATNYGLSDKVEFKDVASNTWVLELEDVEKETSKLLQKVRFCDREFKSSKNKFHEGDVVYGKLRPYLDKVLVADESGVCTTEMIPVRAHAVIVPHHLRLIMKSPYFKEYANNSTHGMNLPRMGTDKARLAVIPIVPEPEQHRIVAKVDELMVVCDQLEQQTESSLDAHNLLVDTLLATLTDARDADELSDNWSCLAEHFDTLISTDYAVEQLKQTIHQLAVMGKLVPQDPNDEPANELLKRIVAEKERLMEEGGLKTKASEEILDKDIYIKVPDNWGCCRLGNLAKFIDYRGKTPKKIESGVRLITAKNVRFGYIDLEPEEFISENEYDSWMTRGFPRVGDILFTPEAPLGNVAIIDIEERFALAQRAICFQLHCSDMTAFLKILIMSQPFQKQLLLNASGMTATGIKASKLKEIPIMLPPLAEQQRIVSKVDELMAICDQLKRALNDARATQLHLADAVTEQALL